MSETIDDAITCHGQSWSGVGCIICIELEKKEYEMKEREDEWEHDYS